ncbi:hypothetical protein B4144_1911 [Bacillus atrophaeus]|nr:hypothetical protein B4144_1911 [Bacillus atrophaeus]
MISHFNISAIKKEKGNTEIKVVIFQESYLYWLLFYFYQY